MDDPRKTASSSSLDHPLNPVEFSTSPTVPEVYHSLQSLVLPGAAVPPPVELPPPDVLARLAEREQALQEAIQIIRNAGYDRYPFVTIGKVLNRIYNVQGLMNNQREFLQWAKANLGYSKSTTYEFIVSYRIFQEIKSGGISPPKYQSHCQLLSKIVPSGLIEAWKSILSTCPDSGVTTHFIESYISRLPSDWLIKSGKRRRSNDQDDDDSAKREIVAEEVATRSFLTSALAGEGVAQQPSSPSINQEAEVYIPYANFQHRTSPKYSFHSSCKALYERGKTMMPQAEFDSIISFQNFEKLKGNVWGNLSVFDQSMLEQVILKILENWEQRSFTQGLFLVPVEEFSLDWVRRLLQLPFCKLNQNYMLDNMNWFIFYMGDNPTLFAMVFESVGIIPGLNSWTYSRTAIDASAFDAQDLFLSPTSSTRFSSSAGSSSFNLTLHDLSGPISPPVTQSASGTSSVQGGAQPRTRASSLNLPISLVIPVVTDRKHVSPNPTPESSSFASPIPSPLLGGMGPDSSDSFLHPSMTINDDPDGHFRTELAFARMERVSKASSEETGLPEPCYLTAASAGFEGGGAMGFEDSLPETASDSSSKPLSNINRPKPVAKSSAGEEAASVLLCLKQFQKQ